MQASFPPLTAVALPQLHAHSPKALPLFILLSHPCTPHPELQGPSHLCSATTFPCDLGQVPEPQGAAKGSGSKNPSRQATQSQAEPDISKTRAQASGTSTAPSSRPTVCEQQPGLSRKAVVRPLRWSQAPPYRGEHCQPQLTPRHASLSPRVFVFFLLPLENIKQIQAITGASHVAQVWERPKSIPGEMRVLESKEKRGKASAWRQG